MHNEIKVAFDKKNIKPYAKPELIFISGPPGGGKKSLSNQLAEDFDFHHLSIGQLLQQERSSKSTLANLIERDFEQKKLINSDLVVRILRKRLMVD